MTYIIKKEEIERVLDARLAFDTVEKAFKAHGLGMVQMPAKSYLQFEKGDLRSMPAYIKTDEWDISGIKSVNVHPKNTELPTVMATILLTDPENGYNIAILDGTFITKMRTGAAGGIATKYLSREDSKVAGFVGCGAQAYTQLDSIMLIRKIEEIRAFDVFGDKKENFCRPHLGSSWDGTLPAIKEHERPFSRGERKVVSFPDTGDRQSTSLRSDQV